MEKIYIKLCIASPVRTEKKNAKKSGSFPLWTTAPDKEVKQANNQSWEINTKNERCFHIMHQWNEMGIDREKLCKDSKESAQNNMIIYYVQYLYEICIRYRVYTM